MNGFGTKLRNLQINKSLENISCIGWVWIKEIYEYLLQCITFSNNINTMHYIDVAHQILSMNLPILVTHGVYVYAMPIIYGCKWIFRYIKIEIYSLLPYWVFPINTTNPLELRTKGKSWVSIKFIRKIRIFFVWTVIPPLITSDFMQTLNNNVTKIYTICASRSNLVYTIDSLPMGSNPLISLNN